MKSIKEYIEYLFFIESSFSVKISWRKFLKIQNNIVKGVSDHSGNIFEDYIFVALKGYKNDGHNYISSIIEKNKRVYIFLDQKYWESYNQLFKKKQEIILIGVKDTRKILTHIVCLFYDFPSKKVNLIGITGTNGKTSTSYIIYHSLLQAGYSVMLIGTYGIYKCEKYEKGSLTTPSAIELQRYLNEAYLEGIQWVVMEVSSHSIYLDRILGCHYNAVIFTSFSRDHLDFHSDMESYFLTKLSLLRILSKSEKKDKILIFNGDMEYYSERVFEEAKNQNLYFKTYSIRKSNLKDKEIDYQLEKVKINYNKLEFSFFNEKNSQHIKTSLLGKYNISNILSVIVFMDYYKISLGIVKKVVFDINIPGRYEIRMLDKKKSYVIIDYAHTDSALKNIMKSILQDICPRRLIVLFGCGGNRDKGKRKFMGKIVSEMSNFAIVTNDNPRDEDPDEIAREIISGFNDNFHFYIKQLDRKKAIEKGIRMLENNDVLLIAGKGSEMEQILKDKVIKFSDIKIAEEEIQKINK